MTELDTVLPPSTKEVEKKLKRFDLPDNLVPHWNEYIRLRDAHLSAKELYDTYHERFKEILDAAEADEVYVNNQRVATNAITGALNVARLRKEAPHVFAAYSTQRVVLELDREKLAELDPQTYEAFRNRSLRHVG